MSLNTLLSLCRFHARRQWRAQPVAFVALAAVVLVMAVFLATCLQQWEEAQAAEQEWQSVSERMRAPVLAEPSVGAAQVTLPEFQSKHLVDALGRVAQETKLPLDEVQFSLDDNGNQPYVRYRATLTVASNYPAIRRFLDLLHKEVAAISLDAISCTREDIGAPELICELALSAFYRKGGHG